MIALIEAHRAGLLSRSQWLRNLTAGLIVGIVALPLAMAFAIASGVRPEQGLYTAIIAGLLVSVCGGSRLQIAGPTGAFVVILSGVTAKFGVGGLQVATLMAGVILIALGFARFGAVIKFIPSPVIVGFTSGIGFLIFVGQWRNFFGLPATGGEHFHEQLWSSLQALPKLDPATTSLAAFSLAVLLVAPRIPRLKQVPAPLLALLLASGVAALAHAPIATIGSAFGGIPSELPSFHWPQASFAQLLELLASAFAIAMLGAIESLLSAVVADGMADTRHDSNQELIGQGIANVVVPLFGGIAATGAIARTATNVRNGATSPIAGITHSVVLLLVVLFMSPAAAYVPLPALAAILWVVAYNMSDLEHVARMLRSAPRADVAILVITFLLTVFADLVVAVNVGIILAMLQFIRRMSTAVEARPQSEHELATELAGPAPALPPGVQVFSIQGPLFFGAVENFERTIAQTHADPKALVIRLNHVPFMDITGLQVLAAVIAKLRKRGVAVVLCEANDRVLGKLQRTQIVADGADDYAQTLATAISRLRR